MLHSTRGIVFHTVKYSETSIIVKVYTELFGIQSYLVRGSRNIRSKTKPGLFQPLTLLDMVVYHKEKHSLQSVREAHLGHPYRTIPFDIRKSSVALFINELVYKAIREEEANPGLFGFLWKSCLDLDSIVQSVSNFHLNFAVHLMHHLGIFPQNNHSVNSPVFNLREGLFQATIPDHDQYLEGENSLQFHRLLHSCGQQSFDDSGMAEWPDGGFCPDPGSRHRLLETLLLYYRLHLPGFAGIQSHHILHDVLA